MSTSTKAHLTVELLQDEAADFAAVESYYPEPSLYGVTDFKAVGTYLEQKFTAHLGRKYSVQIGNSASGIDLPSVGVDIKVISVKQPQSSCPFKSGRQKIFGLGYSLIIFAYAKTDDPETHTSTLDIKHTIFISHERTADYQTTKALKHMINNGANTDDIIGYMGDHMLPLNGIEKQTIADELLAGATITQGYLTVSNALQWRLQYGHAIKDAGSVEGSIPCPINPLRHT